MVQVFLVFWWKNKIFVCSSVVLGDFLGSPGPISKHRYFDLKLFLHELQWILCFANTKYQIIMSQNKFGGYYFVLWRIFLTLRCRNSDFFGSRLLNENKILFYYLGGKKTVCSVPRAHQFWISWIAQWKKKSPAAPLFNIQTSAFKRSRIFYKYVKHKCKFQIK